MPKARNALRKTLTVKQILLLVYVLYLLFQLKSHAYMYESTPQHVIDEESHPGLLADMLNSSSSSDSSSSSNDSDSDATSGSHHTASRIKRAFKGRKRRKSNASSKETTTMPSAQRTPSSGTFNDPHILRTPSDTLPSHRLGAIFSGDEADSDGEPTGRRLRINAPTVNHRDFENEKSSSGAKSPDTKPRRRKSRRKHRKHHKHDEKEDGTPGTLMSPRIDEVQALPPSPRVSFVQDVQLVPENSTKRVFNIGGISVRPSMPKMLTSTVFSAANPTGASGSGPPAPVAVPRVPYGLRRATSLPDRLNQAQSAPSAQAPPHLAPQHASSLLINSNSNAAQKKYISSTSAVVLLLISTGLVAVCAEFLVSSINYLVDNTNVSEAFIGLIILPIVGNAAEHVTAVTVASKNKMDLAIGVAVGSSIQIALFVTPVIVLLGWALSKDMSLYFSLFETISLFVSVFVVNFLVLDGRSNYLEGALLIAAYIIIAVAAFFYPGSDQQSTIGGAVASLGRRFL